MQGFTLDQSTDLWKYLYLKLIVKACVMFSLTLTYICKVSRTNRGLY